MRAALISSLIITLLWVDIPKRAFRFYEKGDIEKTVDALEKSLEKDTLNPAAYFLYSKLYVDTAYYTFDKDSAYLFINKAIEQLPLVQDEKDIEDLAELGIDSISLEERKDFIDAYRFDDILEENTIAAFNWFMENHTDAKQVPEAIRRRNRLAFEDAAEIHTWQAYKGFMDSYPQAEDFSNADDLYKKLIYEERTADGSEESLLSFIEEFPQTPYRGQIEIDLFPYLTDENTLEAYKNYLQQYPNPDLINTIGNRAYHIYKELYPREDFFRDYKITINTDSLNTLSELEEEFWLHQYQNGKIQFMNSKGEKKSDAFYDEVSTDCLCLAIENDFVLGKKNGIDLVLARNGSTIYSGNIEYVRDEGYGLLVVGNVEGERLIHKSGEVFIANPKEEINAIDNRLIRIKENGFYGLSTILGTPYLDSEFVLIEEFNQFFWLEKEDGIQLVEKELIFNNLESQSFTFEATYDEIDTLDNGRIWAVRNDSETILDKDLNVLIPLEKQEIYDRDYGWKIIKDEQITLLHDGFPFLRDSTFDDILENDRWLALEKDSAWSVYDQVSNLDPAYNYDSLALLGENMLMLFRNDSSWAQFKNGKQILMTRAWEPSLLVPQNYVSTGEKANNDFFMLTNNKKYRKIYNQWGREILSSTMQDVVALDPNMLRLQKRNAALADSTGNFLLNYIYDGIGSNNNGYVSILDKGKVGVINPSLGFTIKPEYDKLLEAYNDSLLIVTEDDYKGFINIENEQLTDFEFDEVEFLTDSSTLARIEEEYLVYNILNDESILEGILEYEFIQNSEEQILFKFKTEAGWGVFDLALGQILEPTFTDIKVLGTKDKPVYFAVKFIEEASLYVVIYMDEKGNNLFTQSLQQDEYFKIACRSN